MAGQTVPKEICDVDAEKILLATIIKQGEGAFYEADAKVKDYDFYLPANKITYMAIGKVLAPGSNQKLDLANILAKVKEIDPKAIQLYALTDYLLSLSNYKINSTDISTIAGRIAKISIVRNLQDKLVNISESLSGVDFNKSLSEILVNVEKPLFEFSNELIHSNDTIDLGSFADGYLEYLIANKPEYQGIATGFPIYDELIGGGLRRPGVHLIAGRAKCGKTYIGLNAAYRVCSNAQKVLYADTELTQEIVSARFLARASGVEIDRIEDGSFVSNPIDAAKVRKAIADLKANKIHYHNISGKDHREWISIFRKWILKEVGFDANGNTNPCLIVLDYIKVMNLDHMKGYAEHQYLGQIITDLHNFCIKYNIAILAFAQLNRDGITKEDQGVIAGSDRLIGLCSSCAMIKKKTADDYADDPKANGDRKLIILASRFGPGTEDGEYINLKTDLSRGLIEEGRTNLQNRVDRNDGGNGGFAGVNGGRDNDGDEQIEF